MTRIDAFLHGVNEYALDATTYIAQHALPNEWFVIPDHIAVKCADTADYEATIQAFAPVSRFISSIETGGRRLGTAQLLNKLSIGQLGRVSIVEIMEPRPEKVGASRVGVEHMEFYYPDFERAERFINDASSPDGETLPYEINLDNTAHQTLILPFGEGLEIKLNNRTLGQIIPEEIANGSARIDYGTPPAFT